MKSTTVAREGATEGPVDAAPVATPVVLIVEEDDLAADAIGHRLRTDGFLLRRISRASWERVKDRLAGCDALVLGSPLIEGSWLRTIQEIRILDKTLPVIAVVDGLDGSYLGGVLTRHAFDFVMRPIKPAELSARIEALLRMERTPEIGTEDRFHGLLHASEDVVIVAGRDGRILHANPAIQDVFGYSPDEIEGQLVAVLMPERFKGPHQAGLGVAAEASAEVEGGVREVTGLRRDGSEFPIELTLARWQGDTGVRFGAVLRDVSVRKEGERKEAEEREQLSTDPARAISEGEAHRRFLSAAIHQADECVMITDISGTIEYVNPAFERTTGYPSHEVVGKSPRILKSGKQDAEFYRNLWDTLVRGDVWRGHMVNRRKDGSLYEEDTSITPVRDTKGAILHYVAVKVDVTERNASEQIKSRAERIEALETLAGGMAHDLNNILTPILGHAELGMGAAFEPLVRDSLQEISRAAERGAELVAQVMEFSRRTPASSQPVDLHSTIEEVVSLLIATVPRTVRVSPDLGHSIPPVLADPTAIHRVLMNLCANATQAMPNGGVLGIQLTEVRLDAAACVGALATLTPGRYARITVSDTGVGMSTEILQRIFEPYFTTRSSTRGTGLGLSVVHGIVTSTGGAIDVSSSLGEGSTFEVYLATAAKDE